MPKPIHAFSVETQRMNHALGVQMASDCILLAACNEHAKDHFDDLCLFRMWGESAVNDLITKRRSATESLPVPRQTLHAGSRAVANGVALKLGHRRQHGNQKLAY